MEFPPWSIDVSVRTHSHAHDFCTIIGLTVFGLVVTTNAGNIKESALMLMQISNLFQIIVIRNEMAAAKCNYKLWLRSALIRAIEICVQPNIHDMSISICEMRSVIIL